MSQELLITAGRGPVEVRWFVRDLAAALCERFHVSSLAVEGPEDEPFSILLELEEGVEVLAGWLGTHTLLRRSALRGRGNRQRWYAGVALLEPFEEVPELDPQDVEISTTRSSGPGGQHVNRTDSAVIARHRPSGVMVRVQDERSQHANRRRALSRLAQVLHSRAAEQQAGQTRDRWLVHHRLVRGSPVRRWEEHRGILREVP